MPKSAPVFCTFYKISTYLEEETFVLWLCIIFRFRDNVIYNSIILVRNVRTINRQFLFRKKTAIKNILYPSWNNPDPAHPWIRCTRQTNLVTFLVIIHVSPKQWRLCVCWVAMSDIGSGDEGSSSQSKCLNCQNSNF